MIELAEVIVELRHELQRAARASVAVNEELRFELGPVGLEATVAVQEAGGSAKVKVRMVELRRLDSEAQMVAGLQRLNKQCFTPGLVSFAHGRPAGLAA